MYVLGVFYNKTDALKYLDHAREKGFSKAYVRNQYELNNETADTLATSEKNPAISKIDKGIYTIQLRASRNPVDRDRIFSGLDVNEIKTNDGLYKYYYGEFKSLAKAKEELLVLKKAGYDDAFIRNLYLLITQ
jgi:hypothetical protein